MYKLIIFFLIFTTLNISANSDVLILKNIINNDYDYKLKCIISRLDKTKIQNGYHNVKYINAFKLKNTENIIFEIENIKRKLVCLNENNISKEEIKNINKININLNDNIVYGYKKIEKDNI